MTATPGEAGDCPTDAAFCDPFTDVPSGWGVGNVPGYFAQYSRFQGGTYRLGERAPRTLTENAPFDIARISPRRSVLVSVDATAYRSMPAGASMGITCWEHQTKDRSSASAFLFFVSRRVVEIGLWDADSGAYHKLARKSASGMLNPNGHPNRLVAECEQLPGHGGAAAGLGLAVNGRVAITTAYASGARNYSWRTSGNVGLLASGKGSDIFYDNFAISALGS